MKYITTLLIIFCFSNGFCQNFKQEWKEVIQFELNGKIKSAHIVVDAIYKKAKSKKIDDQIIKCFFYQSKFIQLTDEDAQDKIVKKLTQEIQNSKGTKKALLNYIYVSILEKYYQNYIYKISQFTNLEHTESKDFKTWTSVDFEKEINKIYADLLSDENQLRETNIKKFATIFEISPYTDTKKISVYDYLYRGVLNHEFKNINIDKSKKYIKTIQELFKSPIEFTQFKTDTITIPSLKKLVELYQHNEKYCLKNYNEDIAVLQYQRMKKFSVFFNNVELYIPKLLELQKTTTNSYLLQEIRVDLAQYYFSKTTKENSKNYYPEVLAIVETALNSKENPNAKAEAETIKQKILGKKITLNIPNQLYQNQNYKAFIEYKNVDTIKVSYYKIPIEILKQLQSNRNYYRNSNAEKIDCDSLVFNYMKNHEATKTAIKVLPSKTDHLNYSTEILMDNLDLGSYLLFFETKNPYGYLEKNAFAYYTIQVSNLDFVHEKEEDFDVFHILNRKTGKPLENVIITTDGLKFNSDKIGKVRLDFLTYKEKKRANSDLLFIKEKDTLYNNFYRSIKDTNNVIKNYQAKAMVFYDRAIYRPGQKVFFKGFLLKNKNKITNTVPFVTLHIIINDANENELKSFEIQTNEFGSFTGEYDIPKDILTGEFSITIEEPTNYEVDTKYYDKKENEHTFWDYVTYYDNKEFRFKVEEYKRPSFEINFEKIKENYTLGDTISIRGNAKNLAGSNITKAKVSYTISNNSSNKTNYVNPNKEYNDSETITDENGDFKIEFVASADNDNITANKIESINFNILTTITDLNGESRTATSSIIVGDKMLKLTGRIAPLIYPDDKNEMLITTTTLNNFPINTKGTITFIEQNKKEYLVNKDRFPELYTIEKSQFEVLFPYEAYDKRDTQIEEKKVLTLDFDTEKSTKVDLLFLKNFKLGLYKIILEAKDKKGTLITTENNFEISSKIKKASNKTLFTFNEVPNDKDYFVFEINSVIPDLYITTRIFDDNKKETERVIQLKNGSFLVKIPKKNDYKNDLHFHFSTIWENMYYSDTFNISKDEIESKIDFEIKSIRNKIEPGSIENWSFIVKNSKMQAEVLASMYDASLDQFATTDWTAEKFYHYNSFPEMSCQASNWHTNSISFENLHFYSKYYKTYILAPRLDWFGFDFNSKNTNLNTQYLKKVASIANIPKKARTIYGVVSDEDGPLPGAHIMVNGTNRSIQTDFDGYYQIDVEKGETLLFEYIGYDPTYVKVNKEKNVNIILRENSESLEEAVVLGYGRTVTKAKTVGATQTGSSNTAKNRPNISALATLQGHLKGANIESSSYQSKKNMINVIIRGVSAINEQDDPLYIIDGFPMNTNDFRNLNPDDIESVTVLKDGWATALYGSQGANGVIVINTKKGLKELFEVKTRTNFNETAFFYPNLTTDAEGLINFNFTTPESLTKWKLRLFAHNTKAETGYFQTEIFSQKDIMVMPNMPRFLREKDTINLAVKVVNLTNEIKSGTTVLLLFDATTNIAIDSITLNNNNTKTFTCKPKQSIIVNWKITIPEGIQGLRYKVIAKSGKTSDGEENILPILTDKILITESIPIWVKGNTKREFTLANLKNNASTTLQNYAFTFEYTSNPVWLALQSLPYLMNYEHDCNEQIFAKYYANCLAEKIISSNPKIEALFKKWKDNKIQESKLKLNEELKSILLAETPWFLDAESEEERNNRLALLMDLNTLKENNKNILKKIEDRILPSGGFAWFNGGNENSYISQHILSGIGHLNTLFPSDSLKYKNIVSKGIPNLDRTFISTYSKKLKITRPTTLNINYLYTRSFFLKEYPLSKKCDSIIQLQIRYCKEDWLNYSLYEKGLLALVMNRFNEKDFAKKIITSLKETVSNNDEIGMYWIENNNGYGWYNSSIETQALLIEAFAEIDKNKDIIDAMKVWLIKNKVATNWPTTKATTEAVYALLYQGNEWTSLKENIKIKMGDENILNQKLTKKDAELDSGYLKVKFDASEINSKIGTVTIDNKTKLPGFGGLYWQYFETVENSKPDSTKTVSIDKKLYKKIKTKEGEKLVPINDDLLKVGDLLTVRLIIKALTHLDFVHLKDLRASCLEPVDQVSKYEWQGSLGYYKSTRDVATNFFFDSIDKGTYILEYDLRITNTGVFNNGISTLQSMYAPEFGTYSTSSKITVKE